MPHLFLNPYIFFLIEANNILIWDYKNNNQYILSQEYFNELLHISFENNFNNKDIAVELENADLVASSKPDERDWGWDVTSQIFHIGTQDVYISEPSQNLQEIAQSYVDECAKIAPDQPSYFLDKLGKLIDLPEPDVKLLEKKSFFSVLKDRKTSRSFNGKEISLQELSLILYAGFGLIHGKEWDVHCSPNIQTLGYRKASPASGALHAEEVYVCVYNVTNLECGIYHYRPQDHKLTQLAVGDFESQIIQANYNQYYSTGLACGVYLTCRLDKLWWKYKHSRAYKVALLDLGHVSQTFLLSTTALNLKTWITAAFQDSIVNQLIQVDGLKESAFLFLGVGHGSNQTVPEALLQILE